MTSYRVYLRSDIQWTMRTFKARTPERALNLARRFAEEHFDELAVRRPRVRPERDFLR